MAMRLYLYGESSLSLLRYLRSIRDERVVAPAARIRSIADALHMESQLAWLSPESERLLTHVRGTIHAIVPLKKLARSRSRLTTHLWSHDIPSGSFLQITDDLFISSPQFAFLQLARSMDAISLAKIGFELCGSYALVRRSSTGRMRLPSDDAEFELSPCASARRLASFAKRMSGKVGAQTARAAARYILDDSASPMETNVCLLLCLPKKLGGYGIPQPVLNPEVVVQTAQGREQRFPDLYWKDASIDLEYQSDFAHSGDWARYRDSKRQVTLVTNKISVLPLTRPHAQDTEDFHSLAIGLMRMLGLRMRGFDRSWELRRAELRRTLLSSPEHSSPLLNW